MLEVFSSVQLPPLQCDNEKCPNTLASVPLGNKKGLLENTCPGGRWQIGRSPEKEGQIAFREPLKDLKQGRDSSRDCNKK